jgi:ubiquinone/menaquinone biosynthesis C-methylase UbiE
MPEYPTILARLQSGGATLLDVGCCFGHILRQLAADGVPATQLAGTDLRSDFVELGYELFRDRETFAARFVTGDVLDPADEALAALDGSFDVVHVASFFHLFGWDDQVKVGERIVRFFKPDAKGLVIGRQVGAYEPLTVQRFREQGGKRYLHNLETMQNMWDVIGEKTGTKWKVAGEISESKFDEIYRVIIRFTVAQLE